MDPKAYRMILFDQRGCGKSKPSGELKVNFCAVTVPVAFRLLIFYAIVACHTLHIGIGINLKF